MSGVKSTSKGSYREHVLDGRARSQRERILDFLEQHQIPANRRQISASTRIPINAVTGRVKALLDNGDLRVVGVMEDPITEKRVEYLEITPSEPKQRRMF